jgi:hypothetical protein
MVIVSSLRQLPQGLALAINSIVKLKEASTEHC